MTADEILAVLASYQQELEAIATRFTRSHNGIFIRSEDNPRVRIIVTEVIDFLVDHVPATASHRRMLADCYNEGVSNMVHLASLSCVHDLAGQLVAIQTRIRRNPAMLETPLVQPDADGIASRLHDDIDRLFRRFHVVARQMRERREERPTLGIEDEYDVQDLLHSLLRLHFDDVRSEEWTPSYAGAASRTDFFLPQIDTFVEVKKSREGLNARRMGEQLIIDIAHYQAHPNCRHLVCFVYDPEGRIANPAGLETDLNNRDHGALMVRVSIHPKTV